MGRRSRHMYSPLTRRALTIQISRKATKSAQTIMTTISEVFRPLGDQKVAGGVVTWLPFVCEAASPRNGPLARDEIQSCRYADLHARRRKHLGRDRAIRAADGTPAGRSENCQLVCTPYAPFGGRT
jgi:hypothetical protein